MSKKNPNKTRWKRPRNRPAKRLAEADEEQVRRWHNLYAIGMGIREVAARGGVNPQALIARFHELGYEVRPGGGSLLRRFNEQEERP
jgi:hypothetical protein